CCARRSEVAGGAPHKLQPPVSLTGCGSPSSPITAIDLRHGAGSVVGSADSSPSGRFGRWGSTNFNALLNSATSVAETVLGLGFKKLKAVSILRSLSATCAD